MKRFGHRPLRFACQDRVRLSITSTECCLLAAAESDLHVATVTSAMSLVATALFKPARPEPRTHTQHQARSGSRAARWRPVRACVAGEGSARRCCDQRHPHARAWLAEGAHG